MRRPRFMSVVLTVTFFTHQAECGNPLSLRVTNIYIRRSGMVWYGIFVTTQHTQTERKEKLFRIIAQSRQKSNKVYKCEASVCARKRLRFVLSFVTTPIYLC
jgi:hypothetical protein